MQKKIPLLLFLFLLIQVSDHAQDFKSIELTLNDRAYNIPALELGSKESLNLSFDDLSDNNYNLFYRLQLCNADGSPSDLNDFEFVNGINNQSINDIQLSINTQTNYTHYSLDFPSNNLMITKSGLFKIQIYDRDDPQTILIEKEFYVYETNYLSLGARVIPPRNTLYSNTAQELAITVSMLNDNSSFNQASSNLNVYVQQNANPLLRKRLDYNYSNQGVYYYKDKDTYLYPGFNEYRNIDLRNLNFCGTGIEHLDLNDASLKARTDLGDSKYHANYIKNNDINGGFVCFAANKSNPDLEGDYLHVLFRLHADHALDRSDVYLMGSFNQWQQNQENQMVYHPDLKEYQCNILLKQGFYDYQFLCQNTDGVKGKTGEAYSQILGFPNFSHFEGSFQETENDYYIFVFYRPSSDRYDHLVAFMKINSTNINVNR